MSKFWYVSGMNPFQSGRYSFQSGIKTFQLEWIPSTIENHILFEDKFQDVRALPRELVTKIHSLAGAREKEQ